jgi:hypothetical protein
VVVFRKTQRVFDQTTEFESALSDPQRQPMPMRNSVMRSRYSVTASLCLPIDSVARLPSVVYRIHQIPDPLTFSYTPLCFSIFGLHLWRSIASILSAIVTLDSQGPTTGRQSHLDSILDFACGSGSPLLNVRQRMGLHGIGKIFGQEQNITTYNLSRMNMLLHGVKVDRSCYCFEALDRPDRLETALFGNRGTA